MTTVPDSVTGVAAAPGGSAATTGSAESTFFTLDTVTADLMEVDAMFKAFLNWDYGQRDSRVWNLYEKNKLSQWNAATDIDWDHEIHFGAEMSEESGGRLASFVVGEGSPVPRELLTQFRWQYQSWMCSQFLHGEQGALVTTARLVETVPDMDAKTYAASQVADEARHVEAFARYVDEKLGDSYPINPGLKTLLHDLLSESRWDIVYLGMQVVVEGLAITALRLASSGFGDPIIRQITKMVASDEARHIAFGVTALTGMYGQVTAAELREREDFLLEAIQLMSRRFMLREVWERMDLDVEKGLLFARTNPMMATYRQMLFQQVIHVLRQLDMLSDRVKSLLLAENLVRPEIMAVTR
ncbi:MULTISPECIES: diiron oxygenase [Streptomyces]|uniref:diiron oxygenase n=1 Tax=Streptomyces TaxID=1883 RepID=UPI00099BFD15|nr:ferritin-like domain-containing protein [Streptomyces sp. NRRL S-623]